MDSRLPFLLRRATVLSRRSTSRDSHPDDVVHQRHDAAELNAGVHFLGQDRLGLTDEGPGIGRERATVEIPPPLPPRRGSASSTRIDI